MVYPETKFSLSCYQTIDCRIFYRYCLESFVLRSNEHNKFIVFRKISDTATDNLKML